jgi:hypothetical protein
VTNIPDFGNAGHDETTRAMTDEMTNNSDTLIPDLVASNTIHGEVGSTTYHAASLYSIIYIVLGLEEAMSFMGRLCLVSSDK